MGGFRTKNAIKYVKIHNVLIQFMFLIKVSDSISHKVKGHKKEKRNTYVPSIEMPKTNY